MASDNPGIYAMTGPEPRAAYAYHGSSYATGTVAVDGTIEAGDVASINIEDRSYTYEVQDSDTLFSIRDALVELINANPNEVVVATAAASFEFIRLRAKIPGPEGNGITFNGSSAGPTAGSTGAVSISATNTALCCANVEGAPITLANPAQAGETIYIYGTGLGLVTPESAKEAIVDGGAYNGPANNTASSPVSALTGGSTATVFSGGLAVGLIGIYQIVLEVNSTIVTNPFTQVTISQDIYTSNIVTIPVYQPNPNAAAVAAGN